jgi:hypothetical protein
MAVIIVQILSNKIKLHKEKQKKRQIVPTWIAWGVIWAQIFFRGGQSGLFRVVNELFLLYKMVDSRCCS